MPGSVFPSAPGYPNYANSIWSPPIFSQTMIERFYADVIFSEISTTDYIGELRNRGDKVIFSIPPKIEVHDGVKDGTIRYQTIEPATRELTVDRILEWGTKMDMLDVDRLTIDYQNVVATEAARAAAERQDAEILSYLPTQVDPANIGPSAGIVSGNINLGTTGAPVTIASGADLRKLFGRLQRALDEQNAPMAGRYIVLPYEFKQFIVTDPDFLLVGAQGGFDPDAVENGMIARNFYGFNVYVSPRVPVVIDPILNIPVHYIVAGVRRATAFAAVSDDVRVVDNDKDSWDVFVKGRMAYGFGVIYPELLAIGYANVDPAAL